MKSKIKLDEVTEYDVALLIFLRTFLDNLTLEAEKYWHIVNLKRKTEIFMRDMQNNSRARRYIYQNGHDISDIVWDKVVQEGSIAVTSLSIIVPLLDRYSESFDRMLGSTKQQVLGIANKFYEDPTIKETKLNSWKTVNKLIKHLNQCLYEYEKNKGSYIEENKVTLFRKNKVMREQ